MEYHQILTSYCKIRNQFHHKCRVMFTVLGTQRKNKNTVNRQKLINLRTGLIQDWGGKIQGLFKGFHGPPPPPPHTNTHTHAFKRKNIASDITHWTVVGLGIAKEEQHGWIKQSFFFSFKALLAKNSRIGQMYRYCTARFIRAQPPKTSRAFKQHAQSLLLFKNFHCSELA